MPISAVVNTHNEERNIVRCLKSVAPYVDEIIIADMQSADRTVELARKFTDRIWTTDYTGYVEPARNFAIGKASGSWILLLDADEVIPEQLGLALKNFSVKSEYAYYRLPRKNLIFGKWVKFSGWWPDYQIRFFRSGAVSWNDEIHSLPLTQGKGTDLPADEQNCLVHYHYESIDQFVDRMNRYTSQEARQAIGDGKTFNWQNLLRKPAGEFLSRFFSRQGYKDGVHGLALSLLQAVSFLVVELKIWEAEKFTDTQKAQLLDESWKELRKIRSETVYWYANQKSQKTDGLVQLVYRLRAKIRI